jgi:hypothetical protein
VVNYAKISGIAVFRGTTEITTTLVVNNNRPMLNKPQDKTLTEGEFWSLQLEAYDADAGDLLTYTARNLPASLMLDSSTGIISGTVEVSAGEYPVQLRVFDSVGAYDSSQFIITITEASGSTSSADVDEKTKDISGENPDDILLFPNPADTEFNLQINVKETSHYSFVLFNVSGIQIPLGAYSLHRGTHLLHFKFTRESIAPGLYYLSIRAAKVNKVLKVAIE